MIPFRQIVVPIDFDVSSEEVTHAALDLADKYGGKITVVHVYPLPEQVYGVYAAFGGADFVGSIRVAAEKALEEAVTPLRHRMPALTAVVRAGDAWQEIIAVATEIGADLIVMGTHGRRGVARVFLGSVAEKVVRRSPVPVLTIRTHGEHRSERE